MKFFSAALHSILLVTTPTLLATPPEIPPLTHHQPSQIPDLRTLSYDEVVDLLALIESDSFDERYSDEEIEQINQFIATLALEGSTLDEKPEIEIAVASLLQQNDIQYAVYSGSFQNPILCKNAFSKAWNKTVSFVKKHKKAIIIGAIVVVTVAVVVVTAGALSGCAAGAASAAGGAIASNDEAPSLQEHFTSFKETVAQEQFAAISDSKEISLEDNGRLVGSLFAHQTIDAMATKFANRSFSDELKDFGYSPPAWLQTYPETSSVMPHPTTDRAFSTNYTATYTPKSSELNLASYQTRGNLALSSGCFTQAVHDFGHAIALDPTNPFLHLERGIANFELGQYENSFQDYTQFVEKKNPSWIDLSIDLAHFSVGFAKGVPKGIYHSAEGNLFLLADFIRQPVQTSKQVIQSITQLAILVKNDEFGMIAQALSPELHKLVTEWDALHPEKRGELAGFVVGKLGADLIAPGAIAKIAAKSLASARELAAICKSVQFSQDILVLETATRMKVPAKITQIVAKGKETIQLGEEVGLSARGMGGLKQVGALERGVNQIYEHLPPDLQESAKLYKNAQDFLKEYKGFMPESVARELIQQKGIPTFPKPQGIPENYRVKLSNNGAGIKYVHPMDEGTYVRVMPGKPHSCNPYQQKPYITHQKHGKPMDKYGNIVDKDSVEAHIPYDEFVYKE